MFYVDRADDLGLTVEFESDFVRVQFCWSELHVWFKEVPGTGARMAPRMEYRIPIEHVERLRHSTPSSPEAPIDYVELWVKFPDASDRPPRLEMLELRLWGVNGATVRKFIRLVQDAMVQFAGGNRIWFYRQREQIVLVRRRAEIAGWSPEVAEFHARLAVEECEILRWESEKFLRSHAACFQHVREALLQYRDRKLTWGEYVSVKNDLLVRDGLKKSEIAELESRLARQYDFPKVLVDEL